jgi:hypothetical protein
LGSGVAAIDHGRRSLENKYSIGCLKKYAFSRIANDQLIEINLEIKAVG